MRCRWKSWIWIDSDAFIKDLNVFVYLGARKRLFVKWILSFFRNKEEYDSIVLKVTTYIIKLTKIYHDVAERIPRNLFLFKMTLINIIVSPSLLFLPLPLEETREYQHVVIRGTVSRDFNLNFFYLSQFFPGSLKILWVSFHLFENSRKKSQLKVLCRCCWR